MLSERDMREFIDTETVVDGIRECFAEGPGLQINNPCAL